MDDLISRQAVLENAFAIYTHECGLVEVVGAATIKDLPSVKPQEPKTGHWIDDTDKRAWKCSECGWWYRDWKRHNFCSYCGAKMIEPNMSENSIDSKDVIWYSKRNYSEIVVEPQERSEE